jgi:diaminopimelate epimerase
MSLLRMHELWPQCRWHAIFRLVELHFQKYEGLGNDFVVLNLAAIDELSEAAARQLCDRHFGIGADGILALTPSERAVAKMTVINADGSRPEMCGNGLRCVALHLWSHAHAGPHFQVETDSGLLECRISQRDGQHWVSISLGRAHPLPRLDIQLEGEQLLFHRISLGNPHAISFNGHHDIRQIDQLGPQVSAAIAGGANVEFVDVASARELRVVVWERGVGRTLACGTGAAAAATAAALEGLADFDQPVTVRLPGGPLEVTVARDNLGVELCGPARHVFSGSIVV